MCAPAEDGWAPVISRKQPGFTVNGETIKMVSSDVILKLLIETLRQRRYSAINNQHVD
jgi:hypothetical protein